MSSSSAIISTSSDSASSITPTPSNCPAVNAQAVGFVGYFHSYTASADLTAYLEGAYKSNSILNTVNGIIDVGTVYSDDFTLELDGYFRAPTSGSYTLALEGV